MSLHPHTAGLIVTLDPRWRRKMFIGGLVLMLPFVGWPAVLGYRARFVLHMFKPTPTALPEWKDEFWSYVLGGWKAMVIIFGHVAPLYVIATCLAWQRDWRPDAAWWWSVLFFAAFPLFSTLSFPVACWAWATSGRVWLTPFETACLLAAFTFLIAMIPAGFLEVSRTGRYRTAFAWWRAWPFAWRHRRLYASAWWHSALQSLLGHLAFPFSPWGVMWCYVGILALFNEILVAADVAPGRGWLQRALADPRFVPPRNVRRFKFVDAAGEATTALNLGLFSMPLPRLFN